MKLKSTIATSLLLAMGVASYAQLGNDLSNSPTEPAEKTAARKRVNEAADKAAELANTLGKIDQGIKALRDALKLSKAFDERYSSFSPRAASELAKILVRAKMVNEALVAFRETFRWSPERSDLITGTLVMEDIANYALLLIKTGKVEEAKAMYYYMMRYWGDNGYQYMPFLVVFEPDPTMTVWESTPDKSFSAILMLRAIHSSYHKGQKERIDEVRKREPSWILPVFYANQNFDAEWFNQVAGMASDQHEKEWVFMYEQAFALAGVEQRNAVREVWLKLGKIAAERRKNSEVLKQAKLDMARLHPKLAAPAPAKAGS